MNLEGLRFPLGAEWVRQGNACKRQELCCVLVVKGISFQQRWLCQGWFVGCFACTEASLWLMADVSFIPCPGCFPAARAAAWLPVEDELFDHPRLEMARGGSG